MVTIANNMTSLGIGVFDGIKALYMFGLLFILNHQRYFRYIVMFQEVDFPSIDSKNDKLKIHQDWDRIANKFSMNSMLWIHMSTGLGSHTKHQLWVSLEVYFYDLNKVESTIVFHVCINFVQSIITFSLQPNLYRIGKCDC